MNAVIIIAGAILYLFIGGMVGTAWLKVGKDAGLKEETVGCGVILAMLGWPILIPLSLGAYVADAALRRKTK